MRVPIRKGGKYTHLKPDPRLTQGKFNELQKKLHKLKDIDRTRAASEVARLAQDGDFSENAGYQIAKGRLRGINQRILELEDHLGHATIIAPDKTKGIVQLGSKVTIEISGKEITYMILGSSETDPEKGIISDHSPIGAVLMDKKVGDTVHMKLADKEVECTIIAVE